MEIIMFKKTGRFLVVVAVFLLTLSSMTGRAWAGIDQWTTNGLYDGYIYAVVISPNYAADQTVYAGMCVNGVVKITNGGTSYTAVNTGITNLAIWSLAISPNYATDQTVYAGTWGGGVFKSTNGGTSWAAVNTGITSLHIWSLAISPNYATDQTVYAGTSYGDGVFKSTNGGTGWTAVSTGITNLNIQSLAISPNYATDQTVYAGTNGNGMFKTTNGGTSWTAVNTGITGNEYGIICISSLAISPNYAADQTVYAGTWSGVYKTTNGGTNLTAVNTGITNLTIRALAISPDYASDQTVLAGTDGGVFKCTNGGTSWTAVNTGLPSLNIYSLAISPNYATDPTVYAGTWNGGIPWYTFSTPPASTITSPTDGATLSGTSATLSGTATASNGVAFVEVSTDNGSTWHTATGTTSWSYSWTLPANGTYVVKSKATDSLSNIEIPGAGVSVTVDNVYTCATPASLTVPASSATGSYTVSWGASATASVTYTLQEATNSTFTTGVRTAYTGALLTSSITGRTTGTYYYRVQASKTGYTASAWRTGANGCVVNLTPPTCAAPASLTVPASSTTGSYTVSWGASSTPGVTFTLQEATNSTFTTGTRTAYTGAALTASITGRTAGTYYYQVQATMTGYTASAWRTGASGCVVTFATTPTCAAPSSLTVPASSTTGSYTVSWGASASTGATYTLQEATNSTFTTGVRTAYTGALLTSTITGRTTGTYYYRVQASKTGYTASAWRTGANGCAVSTPSSSAPFQTLWTRQMGTSNNDEAYGVSVDVTGNVYVAGSTYLGGLDGNTSTGGYDLFVIKYNSSGVKQWTRQLGTTGRDEAHGVSVDGTGNVYVAGTTYGGLDGNRNAGGTDLFIVKYDTNGVKQWTLQWGSGVFDEATGISVDGTGNVYVTGTTYGVLGESDFTFTHYSNQLFVVKYNSAGVKQWAQQLGTTGDVEATGISVDGTANVYVTGDAYGELDGNNYTGGADVFIVKYNSAGARQWTRQMGTSGNDVANGVSVDGSGNVYAVGYTTGVLDGTTNAGYEDLFVVKYDSAGVKQWTRQRGTSSYDLACGVSVDGTGNVYVAGSTSGGLDGNTSAGNADVFVVKYNSAGVKLWTRQMGTVGSEGARGASVDGTGNVYVAGSTSGGLGGNTSAGYDDLFVMKLGPVAACATPASITVPASSVTGSYTVRWGASSTTGATYSLQEATNSTFTTGLRTAYSGTLLTASITGRATRITYYYRVQATKTGCTASAWRTGSNGCAAYTCGVPSSLTVPASSATGSYTVSWGASATAGMTYSLQEATNIAFTTGLRTAYTGTALSKTITARVKGNTYYYRVKATKTGATASLYRTGANGCWVH